MGPCRVWPGVAQATLASAQRRQATDPARPCPGTANLAVRASSSGATPRRPKVRLVLRRIETAG
jgi:hypothetical protein